MVSGVVDKVDSGASVHGPQRGGLQKNIGASQVNLNSIAKIGDIRNFHEFSSEYFKVKV